MKVDFTPADRPLVTSAMTIVRKALERAASAARSVGHSDQPFTADLAHLEHFEKRYKGKGADDGNTADAVRLDIPEPECVVMRTGIILLLERHQRTESTLQEELALTDNALVGRLGDLRTLGLRLGGQPDLFDPKTADEKAAMAAEMGMPAAAVGAAPSSRAKGKRSTPKSGAPAKRKK